MISEISDHIQDLLQILSSTNIHLRPNKNKTSLGLDGICTTQHLQVVEVLYPHGVAISVRCSSALTLAACHVALHPPSLKSTSSTIRYFE